MGIWDSIKDTAESLGGAVTAPAGAVWDIASAPFDDDENDNPFKIVMNRGGQMLDPLLNQDTFTGYGAGKVMDAANWALDNAISEPISTAFTMGQHAAQGDTVGDRFGALFSGDQWKRAYEIAQEQNAGQSMATGLLDSDIDPFDYENPYDEVTHPEHGGVATTLSWGANIAGSLVLDPAYLGGKAIGAARQASMGAGGYGKLSTAQKAELGSILNGGDAKAAKRIDRWADFVSGTNAESRALTGPEILATTPELTRWAKEPRVVSALVADAAKIENPGLRRNTIKDILAVAGGDDGALIRLQANRAAMPAIADQLKNMRRGNVLDLEKLAANPELQFSPLFTQHLERQLANLNSDKGIDKAILAWDNRLEMMQDTWGMMSHLPGVHLGVTGKGGKAGRGLRTANDKGLGQKVSQGADALEAKAIGKVDEVASKIAAKSSHSLMVQKGLRTVPVLAIKSTAFAAAPYTKFPAAMAGAMRQTHFTGVARFDEWDDAVTQFDSMLKMSHVPTLDRMNFITKATLAGSEMEKEAMVRQAERIAMTSLTEHFGVQTGENISKGYIEALMENHFKQRGARMSQLYGRAYAATTMGAEQQDGMIAQAMRQGNIAKAEDAAKWNLRVDQFLDDEGLPVALPLMETQLRNAMPLLDMHLAKKLVGRDQSHLARLGRAWDKQAEEIHGLETRLGRAKGRAAETIQKQLDRAYAARDWMGEAGAKSLRVWKMSVLFRLGYPARVVLDDHWRIWSRIGAGTFYAQNAPEAARNFAYNRGGGPLGALTSLPVRAAGAPNRRGEAVAEMAAMRAELGSLKDELTSDRIVNYPQRLEAHRKAANSLRAHKGQLTKLRNKTATESYDAEAIGQKIAHHEQQVARFEAEMDRLQQQMGDMSPEDIQRRLTELNAALRGGVKGNLPEKRNIGQADVELSGGEVVPGAFAGPQGRAYRGVTGSSDTFDYQIKGVEEKTYGRADRGAHVTVNPDAPHHLDAWADSLNNQIKNSRAAMFFVRGGDREGFVKWIKEPEQADLRRRLPHLAHDPEEWGGRIESMVDDYLPTTDLREAMKKGTVTPKWLAKHHPEGTRPAVHGPMVADTIGTSDRALGIGRRINDTFTWLASEPTDRLSRHPFFSSMYKLHAEEFAAIRREAAAKTGRQFTQEDLAFIERQARRAALVDLKRTLFDMSAHSHAAHVMRFISPFFAAHQEVVTRWWRIVQDNPGIVRRAQQAFDAPRYAGLVVDENGDPVEPGEMPSPNHKLLLPIPFTKGADWSINENSFNLILQNGITNPGVGPVVQMPLEYLASKYPEDEEIARVARIFSPFPPDSPTDAIMPATFKRLMAAIHGASGADTGVGTREFNDLYATNITDRVVDFHLKNGREPNQAEMDQIWEDAKHESTVEAYMRFVQNVGSPFPARPNSRYAAIQQGWYKLSEMGRQKYPNDFVEARDWATEKFKEEYGEAYLALTYSDVNNPTGVDGSPAEVAAFKRYKGVLDKTDPRLARGVIGPALTALDEQGVSTERSDEGRNWFEDQGWISADDPETAATEAQSRRGWQMLDDITNRLNMAAEQMGLRSYVENEKLVLARKTALAAIKAENESFKSDIESINGDSYDSLLREMRQLTETSQLRNDPTRTDIDTLEAYLQLRDGIMGVIQQRQAAGLGGPDAKATEPIRQAYTRAVAALAAQNTFFESGFYNGVIERDPLMIGLD